MAWVACVLHSATFEFFMCVCAEGLLANVLGNLIGTVTGISYGLWLVATRGVSPVRELLFAVIQVVYSLYCHSPC